MAAVDCRTPEPAHVEAACAEPSLPLHRPRAPEKHASPSPTDRSNLAHGWLPFAADSIRQQFGTQMPQGGHPPHHSITSSVSASSRSGTVRPSALAVLRLMTSMYLVGNWTGRSAGFSPLRMRSM